MRVKHRYVSVVLVCVLLATSVLALTVETASAQSASYLASVNTTKTTIYSNVGKLVKFSFQAVWSYGDNVGQAVEYANMAVEVRTAEGAVIDMMVENTTSEGVAYFNYTSSKPQILTFTPIILITPEKTELNSSRIKNSETALYGLQSETLTVYWDTFDVELISTNTETLEAVQVTMNVTYLLVPEQGLTIQASNTSQQEFFPKIAHGVMVTINGVQAEETAVAGIYSADVSTLMPTAYVIVKVSQEGGATAPTAFSFAHDANLTTWTPLAIIIALGCVVAFSAFLFFYQNRKRSRFQTGKSARFRRFFINFFFVNRSLLGFNLV